MHLDWERVGVAPRIEEGRAEPALWRTLWLGTRGHPLRRLVRVHDEPPPMNQSARKIEEAAREEALP